ncbi:MAG: LysM peptidoglycan-binding domain-containing protein [Gemmatimonadales bacterium]
MSHGRLFVLLAAAFGCALPPDPGVPVPTPAPQAAAPASAPAATRPQVTRADIDLTRRVAADSAADAAVLDLLAQVEAPGAEMEVGVGFDLDVATWAEHERVQYYLKFFQGPARERMAIWLERLPRYETHIRERLQHHGVPGDLVYLALIESGLSNTAVSRSRAVGMWQFMLPTGRMFGMRVDSWVDERRDFYKATDAAARYLADLSRQFGSHFLAAAAYNGGPGRVSRGLNRIAGSVAEEFLEENGSLLSDAGFFQLSGTSHIHQETKDYVPKLLAATMIAKEPARYGFNPSRDVEPLPFDSLVVRDATGLDVVAKLSGTSLAVIRELNPQYLRMTTPPGRTSVIRLPAGSMPAVTVAYAALPVRARVVGGEHVVRRGETLAAIARRYGVSQSVLADANPGIGRGNLIRVGQRLRVPGSTAVANAATNASAPAAGSARAHVVARGETLGEIARRYGTTTARLAQWNDLPSSGLIQVGQRLQVAAGPATRATTSASTGGASRTHTVGRGESLSAIATRYGVSVQAIQGVNNIASANRIRVGQRLRIP